MKKRLLSLLAVSAITVTLFAGCGSSSSGSGAGDKAAKEEKIKVGMVTDSGTIDDKSFNQGTWEGLKKTETDFGPETKYLKPSGETEADYLKNIGDVDAKAVFCLAPFQEKDKVVVPLEG